MYIQVIISEDREQKVDCYSVDWDCPRPEMGEILDVEKAFPASIRLTLEEGQGVSAWIKDLQPSLKVALNNLGGIYLFKKRGAE